MRTIVLSFAAALSNVTRERIRQIENKALRKLRHPSRTKHIRDFYGLETKRNSSENQPRTTQQAPAPERQSKEPFDYFSDREFDTEIQDVLDHLTAKESTIFSLRFGIDYGHCLTPEEMEVLYGVTKTELHSVETKALLQMDSSFREKFKAAFYGRSTPK